MNNELLEALDNSAGLVFEGLNELIETDEEIKTELRAHAIALATVFMKIESDICAYFNDHYEYQELLIDLAGAFVLLQHICNDKRKRYVSVLNCCKDDVDIWEEFDNTKEYLKHLFLLDYLSRDGDGE